MCRNLVATRARLDRAAHDQLGIDLNRQLAALDTIELLFLDLVLAQRVPDFLLLNRYVRGEAIDLLGNLLCYLLPEIAAYLAATL
ncbi:MAG TPA: hypothetical protein VGD18_03300, partial [Thiobacillaceae bacterium]